MTADPTSAPAPSPRADDPHSVGVVETRTVHLPEPLELESGEVLPEIDIAYETYGELNGERSNAVLICHALSGDAHAAGHHPDDPPDAKAGWWDLYIGPGKPVDTDHYFVISSNCLGGCKGTTGPAAINPETGKPYGLDFPIITVGDMVELQRRLIERLGIQNLLAVIGGSMGGMQVLEWAVRFPDRVAGVIPIATTASLGAQPLAFDAVGRNAIRSDPQFHDGRYAEHNTQPARGLAIARMLGHITYLSEEGMQRKFGRSLRHGSALHYDLEPQFSVETYLDHQGDKFVERFDANTYLYLTRAMDYFNLGDGRGGLEAAMGRTRAKFLVASFTSDWLFPSFQSRRIVSALTHAGRTATYLDIPSDSGHDTFLLNNPHQERAIAGFLRRLTLERENRRAILDRIAEGELDHDERRRRDLERIDHFVDAGDSVLDLGCGDGAFLSHLRARGAEQIQGVDNDVEKILAAIDNGVDAIQSDLDQPMPMFADESFDVVLLSRTLQVVRHPPVVMEEMLRIGRKGIVTFPNFGYWRNRHMVAWTGRVPVSRNLPFSWADTPNLHHLSIADFEKWCRDRGVRIIDRIPMDYASGRRIHILPNLLATDAIYVISRE